LQKDQVFFLELTRPGGFQSPDEDIGKTFVLQIGQHVFLRRQNGAFSGNDGPFMPFYLKISTAF
jgi:hypothetical protein